MSTPIFAQKKAKILSQLAVPETEYSDLSPKGSVDAGIRNLIDEINSLEGVVTTSSCAGRVSVYLEGHKLKKKAAPWDQKAVSSQVGLGKDKDGSWEAKAEVEGPVGDDDDADEITAGRRNPSSSAAGGKGGGEWLFVSHDPLPSSPPSSVLKDSGAGNATSWSELFGLENSHHKERGIDGISGGGGAHDETSSPPRLIHFKFEPMILHVLTASHSLAQMIIQAGMEAGFRETGAVSLLPSNPSSMTPTPMVAVRSMGLSFESLIGIQTYEGKRSSLVSAEYLELLVKISHERFAENQKRIARFREALKAVFAADHGKKKNAPGGWEDGEARRERKRLEGLRRREELRQRGQNQPLSTTDDQEPLDLSLGLEDSDI
ncbi:tRNA wybutosine-synthesizing protein [Rhypophila sp. PSN 637]